MPPPPPLAICPRCGSPSTEIVGRLDDGRTLIVRCSACGAHATVITPDTESAPFVGVPVIEVTTYA